MTHAWEVPIGGLIPIKIKGRPHIGIRFDHRAVSRILKQNIPPGLVIVVVVDKSNMRRAFVGVEANEEFHIDPNEINPFRQQN